MAGRPQISAKAIALTAAAVLVGLLLVGLLGPASAHADVLGIEGRAKDIAGGVKDLAGGVTGAPGKLGASVLKDALEWLLGGMKAAITLGLVKFLVTIELPVGGSLAKATGPLIVIGGFFLVVGLITSIGDGYREIVAGTDTAPRVIGQAIIRTIGLAVLLGSWFWIVPLAVDMANGMSHYVLSDGAVGSALRRTFASESLLKTGFPLLGLLTGIFLAFAILILVVLKFVIAIAFAVLYVGGPALIGFANLPRIGKLPLAIATRGLLTLTLIPLAWTVVFVAWAGVSAGTFDAATGKGSGVVTALMGPGLFLAGLVVMLAVTKKVLSMASFGLPLSVPGAGMLRGILRTAVTLGAAKALSAGAGAAVQSMKGGVGGGTPEKPPERGVEATREASARAQQTPQGRGNRRPLQTDSYTGRQQHQARTEKSRRDQEARASDTPLPVRGDEFSQTKAFVAASRQQLGAMQSRVDALGGKVTPAMFDDAAAELRPGGLSAAAGAARRAMRDHPNDPARAQTAYQDVFARHTAGMPLSDGQRHAADVFSATPVDEVWTKGAAEWARFQYRQPEAAERASSGYDEEPFRWGRSSDQGGNWSEYWAAGPEAGKEV